MESLFKKINEAVCANNENSVNAEIEIIPYFNAAPIACSTQRVGRVCNRICDKNQTSRLR